MQNINWDMMTQFVFPEQLGLVDEVITCNVIPRWQQIETEDSIQLHGIYHITAVARFNPNEIPQYSEGTLIEELEFDGNNGYFEYALPLNVDLPREKVAPNNKPELEIDNIQYLVYDGCSCTFKWEVNCSFEEPVQGALFNYEPTEEPPIINYRTEEPQQETTKEIRFGHDAIFPEEPNFGDFPVLNVTETNEDGQTMEDVAPVRNEEYSTPQEVQPEETLAPEQNMAPIEEVAPAQEATSIEEIPTQKVTPVQNEVSTSQEAPEEDVVPMQPIKMQDAVPPSDITKNEPPIQEIQVSTWIESSSSSSLDLAAEVAVNQGTIIQDIDEKQINSQIEEPQKKEKIIHSNQYFPTDADDFYNELKESYTILNISNKIRHE